MGCMHVNTGQVNIRCGALIPLPYGHIFLWICVLKYIQVSAFGKEKHKTRSPKTHLLDLTVLLTVGRP